jgi:hypothetical protein
MHIVEGLEYNMATKYSPQITTSGLVFCVDAGNRKSYPDSGNTWFNLVNNGISGSLINGPTFSSNNAGTIILDGTNDYIQTNFSTDISTAFTVSTSFYNTYTPADIRFLASMNAGADANTVFRIELNNTAVGSLEFGHRASDGTFPELISTNFPNNTWHTVTIVWDGTTKYIYKNGILDSSVNSSLTPIVHFSGATLRIAARQDVNLRPMSGRLATFYLYNRALSAQEVTQNYLATRKRFGI